MSFVSITKELLNKTYTENGDKSFVSSLSSCLDLFSLVGGKREDLPGAMRLFVEAFVEDSVKACELMFYVRDPRDGIGERRLFRLFFGSLCASYPELAGRLLPFVPKYGRYDDLLVALKTPAEPYVLDMIQKILDEDEKNKREGKPVSLLAKWLPSINTSSKEARELALYLAEKLGMSKQNYRKTLSFLRKGLIVENPMREKEYTFEYAEVPSQAMAKYRKAFLRNDEERYVAYLESVAAGKKKMNVDVLDVVLFVRRLRQTKAKKELAYFDSTWKSLVDEGDIEKRTLVVRDGSGSMYCTYTHDYATPAEVADAMALLTASRLKGEFHDKFITFSDDPEIVDLSGCDTIKKKLEYLEEFDDVASTDIQKVYELILNVYSSPDFKKEDALDQILIISDMEFNQAVMSSSDEEERNDPIVSTFELFDEAFKKLGFTRPEVVFWNVASRHHHVPVTKNELGVKMISGGSKNVIDLVCQNDSLDPEDFMNKVLSRYNDVAEAIKEE